jgi:hypothetical protein
MPALAIKLDVSDLQRVGRRWVSAASATGAMDERIAASLNYLGEQAADNIARDVARATGLNEQAARRLIDIRKASRDNLSFEIDVGQALIRSTRRPLPKKKGPKRDETGFYEGQLVNIVTMGDERVCELCEELARNSPYTIEEARAQLPHHPNCRCSVEDFGPRRRKPVEMREARAREAQQDYRPKLTLEVLRATVSKELKRIVRTSG